MMPFPASMSIEDIAATEHELARVVAQRERLMSKLAQPHVNGSWAEKLSWQLAAFDRWIVRLRGMLS